MTIEEAIHTAIEYENNVRDVYRDAAARVADPIGKKVFTVLAKEEQHHVDYLESRLKEWRDTGKVKWAELETVIPDHSVIDHAAHSLSETMSTKDRGTEMELLRKALAAEHQTSAFYIKMVAELPPEGQKLFEPFIDIEDGHVAIVQAEMDSLTGTGAWFDVLEVDLES